MKRRTPQPLSPKQRLFVARYVETRSAADAYREVYGVPQKSAESAGPRLLKRAPVAAAVDEQLRELEKRSALNAERIDEEIASIAYFDPRDLLDPETGAMLPAHRWPERARRAIVSFEEEALFADVDTGGRGPRGGKVRERLQVGVVRKVRWHNKVDACRLGLQRVGALVEKHQHAVVTANATDDITDEELEMLAELRHKIRAGPPGAG